MKNAELLFNLGGIISEGICYDEVSDHLYWLDLLDNKIFIYSIENNTIKIINLNQNTGCLAVRENGGLVAALQHGIYFVDIETSELELIVNPEEDKPNNRFNDGKCDCMGRLWAGTMSKDLDSGSGDTTPKGALYCLDTDLNIDKKLDGVAISNGIGFSPDNKIMYYIDSPTMEILAFDFDKNTGNISNKKTVVTVSETTGMPDGMTVDAEGSLWVAMWGGASVVKYDPETGKELQKISIPAPNVTSMVFGGQEMDELFVCTAKLNTDLNKYPDAGGVFKIKVDIKGQYTYKFKG
jgi:sugar lactone lactonase YvrE